MAVAVGDAPFVQSHDPRRLDLLSPLTCRECHQEEYERWAGTNHQLANRAADAEIDAESFEPARTITHGGSTYRFEREGDTFRMVVTGRDGEEGTYELDGVLGVMPLRQYLFPAEGGKWQTTPMAWDPRHREWFYVFDETRDPGEWGHWLGQGMNWNANCAYCHMTDYHKNYRQRSNSYRSTWLDQGISCVQCHSGMEEHVRAARAGRPPPLLPHSQEEITQSCAACHSRREHLTMEAFQPGDSFHDHFRLVLPAEPGVYYPDGQVLDEDFEYGSFLMSRMGHKGVSCIDCHDPHSLAPKLPVENNQLCMQCHGTGSKGAVIVDPAAHSNHPKESAGNSCVACHMPTTAFMQRHDRRDHGFISPDPVLTLELGIPNSCNRCHTDQSAEWAAKWTTEWYGENMNEPRRTRARLVARAHGGDSTVITALLQAARDEENAAWRATLNTLLGPRAAVPAVRGHLIADLEHDSPLVRSASVQALGELPGAARVLRPMLDDESRLVRIDAAFALRGDLDPDSLARQELGEYLAMNSDSPGGVFRAAELYLSEGEMDEAAEMARHARVLEPKNPEVVRGAAVVLSRAGKNDEAVEMLEQAIDGGMGEGNLYYSLGLLYAEMQRPADAIRAMEDALKADPNSIRAYYNLALLYLQEGDASRALRVINDGERLAPNDRDILHAKASILQRLGRHSEAENYMRRLR